MNYLYKPSIVASFHHTHWNELKTELNRLDSLIKFYKTQVSNRIYKFPDSPKRFTRDQIYCGIVNHVFAGELNSILSTKSEVDKFLSQFKRKRLELIKLCALHKSLLIKANRDYLSK